MLRREVLLVLALSLGRSGVYAVVSLIANLTSGVAISSITAGLNGSKAPNRPTLDLVLQLLGIGFALVPVLLACYLLVAGGERATKVLGIDLSQPWTDIGFGVLLALAVGLPGLGLVALARHLGYSANVVASSLPAVWWRIPVLLLSALQNALLEETVVVGYLLHRLDQLGWRPGRALLASATLRGSYHLYQGFGGFLGNAAMGVVFGILFRRWRRVTPMIIAHGLIDTAAFLGYLALHGRVAWLP